MQVEQNNSVSTKVGEGHANEPGQESGSSPLGVDTELLLWLLQVCKPTLCTAIAILPVMTVATVIEQVEIQLKNSPPSPSGKRRCRSLSLQPDLACKQAYRYMNLGLTSDVMFGLGGGAERGPSVASAGTMGHKATHTPKEEEALWQDIFAITSDPPPEAEVV